MLAAPWLKRLARVSAIGFVCAVASLHATPPPLVDGSFSIVVLPDTQYLAEKFPDTYRAQGRWIGEQADRYAIRGVLHVGDVTQNNTPQEWQVAKEAHALFANVPCAVAPGNHDLGPGGKGGTRETLFNDYFPLADFKRLPTFGGVYDREPERAENNYHLIEAGGRRWLLLALEFGPRDDVVRWANDVVKRYPDRSVILVTHGYLRPDNTRSDRRIADASPKAKSPNKGFDHYGISKSPDGFNDGEDLWRKLVSPNRNVVLVVNGHISLTGYLESVGEHGQIVHQMLVNYSNEPRGGDGFFRLLQFLPDGRTLRVRDYSPVTDETITDPARSYDVTLAPALSGTAAPK